MTDKNAEVTQSLWMSFLLSREFAFCFNTTDGVKPLKAFEEAYIFSYEFAASQLHAVVTACRTYRATQKPTDGCILLLCPGSSGVSVLLSGWCSTGQGVFQPFLDLGPIAIRCQEMSPLKNFPSVALPFGEGDVHVHPCDMEHFDVASVQKAYETLVEAHEDSSLSGVIYEFRPFSQPTDAVQDIIEHVEQHSITRMYLILKQSRSWCPVGPFLEIGRNPPSVLDTEGRVNNLN